ncbi:MAG: sortase [Eubacteriales bacterium]|nr:sortase [Eubacteriales bacterium]
MSFDKELRRFQKDLKRGKYRKAAGAGCLAVALGCGIALGAYYAGSRSAEKEIDALRELKEASAQLGDTSDLTVGGKSVMMKYEELFAQNPDMIGWLSIDGTSVDYPVMWTPEDPDYYSQRGFDKKESKNGLLFMDGSCNMNGYGGNVIIYGHNMKNGSMFADLLNYRNESYFQEHPRIQLDTLSETRIYEVCAVLQSADMDKLPFGFTTAKDEDAEAVIETARDEALYDTGADMRYGDDFLTLATCDYSEKDGRLVVMARRVE